MDKNESGHHKQTQFSTSKQHVISNNITMPETSASTHKVPLFCSFRLLICTMLMIKFFTTTSLRMNLGMAIVCMVNSTAIQSDTNVSGLRHSINGINDSEYKQSASDTIEPIISSTETYRTCTTTYNDNKDGDNLPNGYQGTLLWSHEMQSQLFSAVFYGNLMTIWISGYLCDRFGPKFLMAFTLANSSLITLLSPLLAVTDYKLFFVARILMGIGEGFTYPSISTTAARWFPPNERSRMAAFYTTGNQLASVVGLLVSSRLCTLSFLGGWPLIFYCFGIVGTIASIMWLIFSSDHPGNNRWVSESERDYINSKNFTQFMPTPTKKLSTKDLENSSKIEISEPEFSGHPEMNHKRLNNVSTPWRSIITSPALYAILITQSAYQFTAVILQSYLPTYCKEVLRLDLRDNGVMSIIPFIVQIFSKSIYGYISDTLKQRKIVTSTTAAKIFQTIASLGCCMVFMVLALVIDRHRTSMAMVTLAFCGVFFSGGICGFFTSMLSIAPMYIGVITSISTTAAIIGSAVGPMIVAFFHHTGSKSEWTTIFLLVAILNGLTGVVFLFFGSAELQQWAIPRSRKSSHCVVGNIHNKVQPILSVNESTDCNNKR